MGRDRRAVPASIQGRGDALEVDLQAIPNKNRGRNMHAVDYDPTAK